MPQYRKKPVVIEAVRIAWETWGEVCDFAGVGEVSDGKPQGCYLDKDNKPVSEKGAGARVKMGLMIPTLEGVMVGAEGDFLIRGINGELYPCKPDIFAATYEPADPE